jgi:hypothetical protein
MKSYSFLTIIILCIAILIVHIFAFYWLQSITQFIISDIIRVSLYNIFWTFPIGLITGILTLKSRLDSINPLIKQQLVSSVYGLTISSFIPKFIFVIIISILHFANYLISETALLIFVPLAGLLSGFLPFLLFCMAFLNRCIILNPHS